MWPPIPTSATTAVFRSVFACVTGILGGARDQIPSASANTANASQLAKRRPRYTVLIERTAARHPWAQQAGLT